MLQTDVRKVRVVRPYFDATPNDAHASFAPEIAGHPVFRLCVPQAAN